VFVSIQNVTTLITEGEAMSDDFINVMSQLAFKQKIYNENQKVIIEAQRQQSKLKLEIEKLEQATNKTLTFSDHATVRLLERKYKLPINEEVNLVLSKLGNNLPDGRYPIGNGCRAVIRENTVITIVEKQ
jgi:hypothetical protein